VICGESGFATTQGGKRGAMLRAYDKKTGEDRGAVFMPAPQTGCPMTYMMGGRQYIVLAIGGPGLPGRIDRLPPAGVRLIGRLSISTFFIERQP